MKDQVRAGQLKTTLILMMTIMIVAGLGLWWLANNFPWGFLGWMY